MVDGKEFFGGDVKTGLKNLPVNMIDKLKHTIKSPTWPVLPELMTERRRRFLT